jgi:hypothetical protein
MSYNSLRYTRPDLAELQSRHVCFVFCLCHMHLACQSMHASVCHPDVAGSNACTIVGLSCSICLSVCLSVRPPNRPTAVYRLFYLMCQEHRARHTLPTVYRLCFSYGSVSYMPISLAVEST